MQVSIRMIILIVLLATAVGCVTKGTHEAVVAERDGLQARSNALLADKTELEGRLAELQSANVSLSSRLGDTQREISDLTKTHDGLVANLQAELASGEVEILRMRDGIQLNVADDVLFPSGSALLNDGGRELLSRVAQQLLEAPNTIRVEGHTDDVPIRGQLQSRYPTNWELAGARAASVVRLMAEHGIEGARMRAVSSGEFSPRVPNDTDERRAKNRRIEIRLLPTVDPGKDVASGDKLEQVASPREPTAAAPADS